MTSSDDQRYYNVAALRLPALTENTPMTSHDERAARIAVIREQLMTLRAGYLAAHKEAIAALDANDHAQLVSASAKELEIVKEHCRLVNAMMKLVDPNRLT